MNIVHSLELYKSFLKVLGDLEEINMYTSKVHPASAGELAKTEKNVSIQLPDDYKIFLLKYDTELSGVPKVEEHSTFFTIGFDFLSISLFEKEYIEFRQIAQSYDKDLFPFEYGLHARGIPLTYSEPRLIYYPGTSRYRGIYLFSSGKNLPKRAIVPDFSDFFKYYIASGCFSSCHFYHYWKLLDGVLPFSVPAPENKWLTFYKKAYSREYKIF